MRSLAILPFILILFVGCSQTCTLRMDLELDLSDLPHNAQCWLADFEDVCISISDNEDFSDTKLFEEDIKRGLDLMRDITGKEVVPWYSEMTEDQRDALQGVMLGIIGYYGVKKFLDIVD